METRVYDTTSATGRNLVPWSGIVLERSWIEWGRYDAFRLRSGYFLTPYGIWNVDHGSPVLISSVLPGFWAGEYFPTRQLGIQALGNFQLGDFELGYRAWVGNGRNPGQTDVDKNKHVGGRVFLTRQGPVNFTLGASGFWGKNKNYEQSIASTSPFRVGSRKTVDYTEFGLGGDLSVNVGELRLRTEIVMNDERYATDFRPMPTPVSYQRDRMRWDAYAVLAYRMGTLEPFIYVEHDRRPSLEDDAVSIYSGGLIYHLLPKTQLKFQGFHVAVHDTRGFPDASDNGFSGWDLRLVAAF